MKRGLRIMLAGALCLSFFLAACQPTPEKEVVTGKNDSMEEVIRQTAPATTATVSAAPSPGEIWQYEKEYDAGRKLVVDAEIINGQAGGAPVVSVEEKPFGDAGEISRICEALCPGYDIRESTDQFTKEQIEENIVMAKEAMQEAKNETDESIKYGNIEFLENEIRELEAAYEDAPTEDSLPETNYQLKKLDDGSSQLGLAAKKNGDRRDISFVNWEYCKGSTLMMEDLSVNLQEEDYEAVLTGPPDAFAQDAAFREEKTGVDRILAGMGIDYMQPSAVTKHRNGYEYFYTRTVASFSETYISYYANEIQVEGEEAIDLWGPEYVRVWTNNGAIVQIDWNNPSQITSTDNENTPIIPLEEAKEIFTGQMDYMMGPTGVAGEGDGEDMSLFWEGTEVHISRIELGLTKLLVKDSVDAYRLIPTWNFMGYQTDQSDSEGSYAENGPQDCFVAINAIDGSIIDRKKMY